MKVGVHTSIAGGLENAAQHANTIGCDTFQMFSANPRGWSSATPAPEAYERFRAATERYGLAPVVVHANYLINLAAVDGLIREKSIAAFRKELERASALGADYLVVHPGSAKGSSPARAVTQSIESLCQAAAGMKLDGLTVLIENTAGQGSAIGRSFDEVAEIVLRAEGQIPVGACIDTAHCFASGYAVHTVEGLQETVRRLDVSLGLARLRVIHANDSRSAFGSYCDRHEHIGKGQIGAEAFARIVRHPELRMIPFICETPVDKPGDDRRNLRMMRKLAGESGEGNPGRARLRAAASSRSRDSSAAAAD
ncbi:MAG: deoxyribonuclease IV [Terriglobia bacterium]